MDTGGAAVDAPSNVCSRAGKARRGETATTAVVAGKTMVAATPTRKQGGGNKRVQQSSPSITPGRPGQSIDLTTPEDKEVTSVGGNSTLQP